MIGATVYFPFCFVLRLSIVADNRVQVTDVKGRMIRLVELDDRQLDERNAIRMIGSRPEPAWRIGMNGS